MSGAILAIRLRALGDVVLVTPALRALRKGFPDAELEVVTEAHYAPLLAGVDGVHKVWGIERDTRSMLELARGLRRRRYRWAVDFFGNPRSAQIVAAAGAERSAGFALRGRSAVYQVTVPRDHAVSPGHREYAAAAHVRLATAVGGIPDGLEPRLAVGADIRRRARQMLAECGVDSPEAFVGLVPAATWPTKGWPIANAALLARRMIDAGRPIVVLSGPGEQGVVDRLTSLVPNLLVLPPCDVELLAGAISQLGAIVGTDSGPRHLAAALGRPTYAWFGPTDPDTWQPPGDLHGCWQTSLPCRACDRTQCPHWSCMPELTADHAARLVLDHLDRVLPAHGQAAALGPAARA